jgi:hypothetical protein
MNIKEAIKKILIHGNRPDGTPAFHASPSFVERAKRAYTRNKKNSGDCADDKFLLLGLSIAEAEFPGRFMFPGWIPEIQKYGVAYAEILEKA